MKYLVTGGTGKLGSRVIETLTKSVDASNIIATVRDLGKAEKLQTLGVDVREADFNDEFSLEKAFQGADRVLIISTTEPNNDKRIKQHTNAITAAKKNGASLIAYTSGLHDIDNPNILALAHSATEKTLKESGVAYTILRNSAYLENELATIKAAINGAPIITNTADGKIGFAPRNDFADAAAAALLSDNSNNKIYNLSGELVTYDDFAKVLGEVLGKTVPVKRVSDEAYAEVLKSIGMNEMLVPIFVANKADLRRGVMEVDSSDLSELLNRPVTSLKDSLAVLVNLI